MCLSRGVSRMEVAVTLDELNGDWCLFGSYGGCMIGYLLEYGHADV